MANSLCFMCLRFKLRTSSLPKALFYLLIPFQHQCHQLCWASSFPQPEQLWAVPVVYLPCFAFPTSSAPSLIWSLSEIHHHHTEMIQLPLSRAFLAGSKKGWWVRPSTRAAAERALPGGHKLPELLGVRSNHQSLWWSTLSHRGRSLCRNLWLLQSVLHCKGI